MEKTITIRKAVPADFDRICHLLAEENLPVSDLNPLLEHFFVVHEGRTITGVIGMDRYGNDGLLRSAIVQKEYRHAGIAASLVQWLFQYAAEQGVTSLYLITNTAETYFSKKGFAKITKVAVPAAVLQSKELNGLCPASSIIMYRKL